MKSEHELFKHFLFFCADFINEFVNFNVFSNGISSSKYYCKGNVLRVLNV